MVLLAEGDEHGVEVVAYGVACSVDLRVVESCQLGHCLHQQWTQVLQSDAEALFKVFPQPAQADHGHCFDRLEEGRVRQTVKRSRVLKRHIVVREISR